MRKIRVIIYLLFIGGFLFLAGLYIVNALETPQRQRDLIRAECIREANDKVKKEKVSLQVIRRGSSIDINRLVKEQTAIYYLDCLNKEL